MQGFEEKSESISFTAEEVIAFRDLFPKKSNNDDLIDTLRRIWAEDERWMSRSVRFMAMLIEAFALDFIQARALMYISFGSPLSEMKQDGLLALQQVREQVDMTR